MMMMVTISMGKQHSRSLWTSRWWTRRSAGQRCQSNDSETCCLYLPSPSVNRSDEASSYTPGSA